ncbi:MAG TPA: hypothetical protein VN597_07410, partial [Streptosporangiaceae bacterium]|nr:hypothetical protein [Streptosporangiaceae bacterium]
MISHRPSRPVSACRAAALACAALAMAVLAGCGVLSPSPSPAAAGPGGQPTPAAAPPAQATQAPPCPGTPAGFSCALRRRIAAVERYLQHRPGMIGIVLRDRSTGAVWRNKYAGSQVYMASTSKLAMAVTLLLQN